MPYVCLSSLMLRLSQEAYCQLYRDLRDVLPLYAAPWWVEATCGVEGWDAVVRLDEAGNPVAALPFCKTRIRRLAAVITPPLTQWVTPIGVAGGAYNDLQELIGALPSSSILDLSLSPACKDMPGVLKGSVQVQYSYVIPASGTMEQIRRGYNEGLKRNLRQAQGQYTLEESADVDLLVRLCHNSYVQRGLAAPRWLERVVPGVFDHLRQHQCGGIRLARHGDRVIAGMLTGWDGSMTYYLAGGRDAGEGGAAAHAWVLDQAIEDARGRGQGFDFEGSMHPGIANFFQSFGATPVSFYRIRRYRGLGRWWKILH